MVISRRSVPQFGNLIAQPVVAGLVPAIHVFILADLKSWMPDTGPDMTMESW
jgi:hypothetical protein